MPYPVILYLSQYQNISNFLPPLLTNLQLISSIFCSPLKLLRLFSISPNLSHYSSFPSTNPFSKAPSTPISSTNPSANPFRYHFKSLPCPQSPTSCHCAAPAARSCSISSLSSQHHSSSELKLFAPNQCPRICRYHIFYSTFFSSVVCMAIEG